MRRPGIGGGLKTSTFVAIIFPILALLAVGLALVSPPIRKLILGPQPPGGGVNVPCTAGIAPLPAAPYIGVAPGKPWRTSLASFTGILGGPPQVVESYQSFPASFPSARVCLLAQDHMLSVIQWNPRVSVADIAAGRYDRYLGQYAAQVRAFGRPVVISFGHEMNGRWFSWGYTHTSAAVFIRAWRHVHNVLAGDGARNIIWMWNVNRDTHLSQPAMVSPPRNWWPGAGYVDWLGIDAYFNGPDDTYSSVFGRTVGEMRKFSHAPVLIAETAVAPGPAEGAQVRSLFAGVRGDRHVLGFVWFDQDRREAWQLEGRPLTGELFRQEARRLLAGPVRGKASPGPVQAAPLAGGSR